LLQNSESEKPAFEPHSGIQVRKAAVFKETMLMGDKKRHSLILFVLGGLATLGPFSVDMYLPGFSAIARDLRTNGSMVGLTLTTYTLGLAFGQLLAGPILDRYGRKGPISVSLVVFVLAAAGCALAPSIHAFIAFRFFLALGSCMGMVGANAVVRDLFTGNEIARALSVMMMVFGVAPVIAPTIGGLVVSAVGWRAIFAVLLCIGLVEAIIFRVSVPETRGPNDAMSLRPSSVVGSYLAFFTNRQFVVFACVMGLTSGMLFSYITGSPALILDSFHFSAKEFGWIFGANAIALTLSNFANRLLLKRLTPLKILVIVISIQSAVALVLFGGLWGGFFGVWATLVFVALYVFSFGFIMPNATALIMQPFSANAGSASALSGGISMFVGTSASAIVSYLYDGSGRPMTLSFLVFTVAALLLVSCYSILTRRDNASPGSGLDEGAVR
jgi:DHA1 family bicyclomycin/chloramphenicol resistance-like MFS transporter